MHDAIMIGVGTAVNDDPRLNGKYQMGICASLGVGTDTYLTVRLLPQAYQSETPQPIVLDPQLRLSPTARMLQALQDETTPHAKNPWLLCQKIQDWDQDIRKRKAALEQAGARIIEHDMPGGQFQKHIGARCRIAECRPAYRSHGFELASYPSSFSQRSFYHGRRWSFHHRPIPSYDLQR